MTGDMLELNLLLIKGYMFLLFVFMLVNDYCNTRIKKIQNKRKSYNLLSKIVEIELNQQEKEQLEFLMYQSEIDDIYMYFSLMIFY